MTTSFKLTSEQSWKGMGMRGFSTFFYMMREWVGFNSSLSSTQQTIHQRRWRGFNLQQRGRQERETSMSARKKYRRRKQRGLASVICVFRTAIKPGWREEGHRFPIKEWTFPLSVLSWSQRLVVVTTFIGCIVRFFLIPRSAPSERWMFIIPGCLTTASPIYSLVVMVAIVSLVRIWSISTHFSLQTLSFPDEWCELTVWYVVAVSFHTSVLVYSEQFSFSFDLLFSLSLEWPTSVHLHLPLFQPLFFPLISLISFLLHSPSLFTFSSEGTE